MTSTLQGVNLATLTSSAAPSLQEFILQGGISDASCEALIHRLQALCDNVDDGIETFKDHEIVFIIRKYGTAFIFRKANESQFSCFLFYI